MTLAIFRTEGNYPVEKNILKILLEKCHFSVVLKFSQGCCVDQMICVILEKMLLKNSFLSVGVKKKLFVFASKVVCIMFW